MRAIMQETASVGVTSTANIMLAAVAVAAVVVLMVAGADVETKMLSLTDCAYTTFTAM